MARYFVDESERRKTGSTCYHEFYRGKWDEAEMSFWSMDSLYIHDDDLDALKLGEVLCSVADAYDPYGVTEIDRIQWQSIRDEAEKIGGELLAAIQEASPWADSVFQDHDVFTILGI